MTEEVKLLGEGKFFNIQPYHNPGNLGEVAVSYIGSLRPHYNINLLCLVTDPTDPHCMIYEFLTDDIVYAEEQAAINRPDGITIDMVKLWVKKRQPRHENGTDSYRLIRTF